MGRKLLQRAPSWNNLAPCHVLRPRQTSGQDLQREENIPTIMDNCSTNSGALVRRLHVKRCLEGCGCVLDGFVSALLQRSARTVGQAEASVKNLPPIYKSLVRGWHCLTWPARHHVRLQQFGYGPRTVRLLSLAGKGSRHHCTPQPLPLLRPSGKISFGYATTLACRPEIEQIERVHALRQRQARLCFVPVRR